jgi:hypothetical protein
MYLFLEIAVNHRVHLISAGSVPIVFNKMKSFKVTLAGSSVAEPFVALAIAEAEVDMSAGGGGRL